MRRYPPPPPSRTTWHPLFIRNLRRALQRPYFQVSAEWYLSQEPLRQDAVVVRKKKLPPGYTPVALRTLAPLLGDITLINVKGVQAQFDVPDYLHLWACASLFCREEMIDDPGQLRLMAVAPRISQRCKEQIERRGRRLEAQATAGISLVTGSDHLLWLVETEIVADPLLRFFSRHFKRDWPTLQPLLTPMERAILMELMAEVRQFNKDPKLRLRYPDLEQVAMSVEQIMKKAMARLSPEERMEGISAEERLKDLSAAERLKDLSAAEILEGLTPDERERMLRLLQTGSHS